jgi:hypothetical protein
VKLLFLAWKCLKSSVITEKDGKGGNSAENNFTKPNLEKNTHKKPIVIELKYSKS